MYQAALRRHCAGMLRYVCLQLSHVSPQTAQGALSATVLLRMHTAVKFNSRIMKADNRLGEAFAGYRSLSSDAGEWVSVKDVFLSPGAIGTVAVKGGCLNMFLPIVGTICIYGGKARTTEVSAEEIFCFGADADGRLSIRNPHRDEVVNFLHVCVKDDDPLFYLPPSLSRLNIHAKNALAQGEGFATHVYAGVYDSREKGTFRQAEPNSSVLAYIIDGAFEVEDRLMECRDALYIWGADEVQFESLSKDAIILFVECSPLK